MVAQVIHYHVTSEEEMKPSQSSMCRLPLWWDYLKKKEGGGEGGKHMEADVSSGCGSDTVVMTRTKSPPS